MNNEKKELIFNVLNGISYKEWTSLKNSIDMYFNKKVANLSIDDKKELFVYLDSKN